MNPLERDPFEDVWNNTPASDKLVIENIATRVNNRIANRVGPAPKASLLAGYQTLILVGVMMITAAVTIFLVYEPDQPETVAIQSDTTIEQGSADAETPVTTNETTPADDQTQPGAVDDLSENNDDDTPEAAANNADHDDSSPADATFDGRNSDPEGGQAPVDNTNPFTGGEDGWGDGEGTPQTERHPGILPPDLSRNPEEQTNPSGPTRVNYVTVKLVEKRTHVETKSTNTDVRNPNIGRDGGSKNKNLLLPEEMPYFQGGEAAMQRYVEQAVSEAIMSNPALIGQSVYVTFVVNSRGKISDVKAMSRNAELNAEAERIISEMPDWEPGSKKGKVDVVVSVSFG